MDLSGRGCPSLYDLSNAGIRAFDMDKRVSSDTVRMSKFSNSVAPPGFPCTEDGEDYMSELAEEIAQTMLIENEEGCRLNEVSCKLPESSWGSQVFLSTSPQSTLTGMSNWDLLSPGASSNGGMSSGVSSPPTPGEASQVRTEDNALDLLYAELLRLKMEDEIKLRQQQLMQFKQQHYQQLLWKMRQKQVPSINVDNLEALRSGQGCTPYAPVQCNSTQKVPGSAATGCYRSKMRTEHETTTPQSRGSRKQLNERSSGAHASLQNSSGASSKSTRSWTTPMDQSSHHHHQQLQAQFVGGAAGTYSSLNGGQHNNKAQSMNRSGMRAVFLGIPGAREAGGTGVFLPRRVGSCADSKRRPACSTVLLPSRIVQALNLNVEDTLACSANVPPPVPLRRELSINVSGRGRNSAVSSDATSGREEWSRRAAAAAAAAACSSLQEVAPNVCLPTEWTY